MGAAHLPPTKSVVRISAEMSTVMFSSPWPSPNPPSKKQLPSSGKTLLNPPAPSPAHPTTATALRPLLKGQGGAAVVLQTLLDV